MENRVKNTKKTWQNDVVLACLTKNTDNQLLGAKFTKNYGAERGILQ